MKFIFITFYRNVLLKAANVLENGKMQISERSVSVLMVIKLNVTKKNDYLLHTLKYLEKKITIRIKDF